MKVLFLNVPFVKTSESGEIYTGPNAGSRWPWSIKGLTDYGCFPFFMAYAVSYLRHNGIDADFYDAVAQKHWNHAMVQRRVEEMRPDVLFLETSTPLFRVIDKYARWAKETLACRVVLVGPHMQAYAHELVNEPHIDHCVIGEYERPALDIVTKGGQAPSLYEFDHLSDITELDGENFLPSRKYDELYNYYDQSMNTQRVQLQINTSRGCPFKCTYCQWPKVMNNGRYRNRATAAVLDEIQTVIKDYNRYVQTLQQSCKSQLPIIQQAQQHLMSTCQNLWSQGQQERAVEFYAEAQQLTQILTTIEAGGVQSIFFDDDTWNLGSKRMRELCTGLKEIGLPWTMMGRIDTSSFDVYDLMVDSGCVGMRFGIESFQQRLLDNTKKKLNAQKSFDTVKYLISRYNNMEFHFTTMKNLPGETDADWEEDKKLLNQLKELGAQRNNVIHWQNSDCIAFPGTELWEEMVAMGKGDELRNFDLYDGHPENDSKLAQFVGWLGEDYRPKWNEYSKLGDPTNVPKE